MLIGSWVAVRESVCAWQHPAARSSIMTMWDFIKATTVCGLLAFLMYSYPVLSQALIITVLCLLWAGYAHRTFSGFRRS
jgi:hypothetical protein